MRTTRANVSVRTRQRREEPPLRGPACDGAAPGEAEPARAGGADRIAGADMPGGGPIEPIGADRGAEGTPEKPGPEREPLARGTADGTPERGAAPGADMRPPDRGEPSPEP
jgi:hypothetical protein